MKRRYQRDRQLAVERFQQEVKEHNPAIELMLPIQQLCEQMKPALMEMFRHVGLQCLEKAGPAAVIQRCHFHKRQNVLSHLSEAHRTLVRSRLSAAYATLDYALARQALKRLHRDLEKLNPSAARSLAEGMEDTLTVHRLRVPAMLRTSLATTNLIESAFSTVDTVCRNVKRWNSSDHRLRWLASALIFAEAKWNRLHGYRQIPLLNKEIELAVLRPVLPRHAGPS